MIYNQFNRNELRDLLKENILQVTFDKKNGDERIMTCTLKTSILPAPKKTDTEKQCEYNRKKKVKNQRAFYFFK